MTKEDSESKKNYSNSYNKTTVNIGPGGPVPFYYTIKVLDKITRGITNLFSDDSGKKPKLEKIKKLKNLQVNLKRKRKKLF